MNNLYFVSVKGYRVASGLSSKEAVNRAIKEHDKDSTLCGLDIGIGRIKFKKGEKMYSMLPYFYYL